MIKISSIRVYQSAAVSEEGLDSIALALMRAAERPTGAELMATLV
jgi:hypothetical protein